MCSDVVNPVAIRAQNLRKVYHLYDRPSLRLKQLIMGKRRRYFHEFVALQDASFELQKGDVLGLVGQNGAGKSTLLQLVCGTLTPSSGQLQVEGRIAALLELGAGFNPDFTGRENIYLSGALMGLNHAQVDVVLEDIIDFSGIRPFIDQPVKTYSSGMFVRLAFSVATRVEPDILVIDEALSVGDGAFAKKSFDRIIELKKRGTTILFCSHNLYQIESLCNKALWMHQGEIKLSGSPSAVINAYEQYLYTAQPSELPSDSSPPAEVPAGESEPSPSHGEYLNPHFTDIEILFDGRQSPADHPPALQSMHNELTIRVNWAGPADQPAPSLAATILSDDGRIISSAGTHVDGLQLQQRHGKGQAGLVFSNMPLLKGNYTLELYLFCEHGVLFYDQRIPAAHFRVESPQFQLEKGLFHMDRQWQL